MIRDRESENLQKMRMKERFSQLQYVGAATDRQTVNNQKKATFDVKQLSGWTEEDDSLPPGMLYMVSGIVHLDLLKCCVKTCNFIDICQMLNVVNEERIIKSHVLFR